MNVIVVGTGYVGLIQGLILAEKAKLKIQFLEKDSQKIQKLKVDKKPHFYEPGLVELFKKNYKKLTFNTELKSEALAAKNNIIFICVGTPQSDSGEADLSYLKKAIEDIIQITSINKNQTTLVIKSTVPPGTTQALVNQYETSHPHISWAMNPEFLREGVAVADGLNPDRIVLGTLSDLAYKNLKKLYSVFKKAQIVQSTPTEAELGKYAMNSLLANLISFSNEISMISENFKNVNSHKVLELVKMDGRWNVNGKRPSITSYLVPGPGFGGSCFPKDVAALVFKAQQLKSPAKILSQVLQVNQDISSFTADKIKALCPRHSKITILGLAFKPDTDDVRESPTLKIVQHLANEFQITIHDPVAEWPGIIPSNVTLTRDLKAALSDSNLAIVVTSWKDYLKLNDLLTVKMKNKIILDTRGYLAKQKFKKTNYLLLGHKI